MSTPVLRDVCTGECMVFREQKCGMFLKPGNGFMSHLYGFYCYKCLGFSFNIICAACEFQKFPS